MEAPGRRSIVTLEIVDDLRVRDVAGDRDQQHGGEHSDAQVDYAVENVGAYYSRDTEDITLIMADAPGTQQDAEQAVSTLAHETVHALQDGDVDLDAQQELFATSYDTWLAFLSVVEGEAQVYTTIINAALWGLDPEDISLDDRFAALELATEDAVIADPNPYLKTPFWFPYTFGSRYVNDQLGANGNAAVRALPTAPPGGTRSIMLRNDDPIAPDPWPDVPPGPTGEDPVIWDSLGAWLLFVRLARLGIARTAAAELAASWQADRLWIYGELSEFGALWRIRLSVESAASDLASVLSSVIGSPAAAVATAGNEVLYCQTTADQDPDVWLDSLLVP